MKEFVIENGALHKYTGSAPDVFIPNEVKRIEDHSIDLTSVKTLRIPRSVREIGDLSPAFDKNGPYTLYTQDLLSRPNIFFECNLSDYLRIKNDSAWIFNYSCNVMIRCHGKHVCLQELEKIVIPNDIVSLNNQLCYCGMKEVVLGEKIVNLWASFFMCSKLEKVVFNDRLCNIGESTFSDCVSLGPTITLPASVKNIDEASFRNCRKLKTILASDRVCVDRPFEEIEHEVRIMDMATSKEIFIYRP